MSPHLMLLSLLPILGAGGDHAIQDLRGPGRVDYLIVAADAYAGGCQALLDYRERTGLTVGAVSLGDVMRAYPDARGSGYSLLQLLGHAQADWGTRFVLLVGAATGQENAAIPMWIEPTDYQTDKFPTWPQLATDFDYATLGSAEVKLHVGRFPVRSQEQLDQVIARTIGYETKLRPGDWQRRVSFLTGDLGYSPEVDRTVETVFRDTINTYLPAAYEVRALAAQTRSIYCPYPPDLSARALSMLNDGSLFFVYVGHGAVTGCDTLRWRGQDYRVLDTGSLPQVDSRSGPPVMIALACWTGCIAMPDKQAFGEALFDLEHGPAAYIGCSSISQPYTDTLLGKHLLVSAFSGKNGTLGEVLDAAKGLILAPDDSAFRKKVDFFAASVQGGPALASMRGDVVRQYNLLGDPALRLRLPAALPLTVTQAEPKALHITAKAALKTGSALVTLECGLDRSAHALPTVPAEDAPDFAAKVNERAEAANDRVMARVQAQVRDGALEATLPVPDGLAPGKYLLRVFAQGDDGSAAGAVGVECAQTGELKIGN